MSAQTQSERIIQVISKERRKMENSRKTLNQSIRFFKDNLIHQYYQFRINTTKDPYKIQLRTKPCKILFIFSHMRSGSSLLTHILSCNPEIIGYGETHINYSCKQDLKDLIFKVYWQRRNYGMSHKYVLDKVLHDHKFLDMNILSSGNVYSIFLLREPKRSLSSMLDLKPHWTEEEALDYYGKRLSMLESYAKTINSQERSLFLTYDSILNQTHAVFDALKLFLGTKEGFSEEYKVLKTTGMQGIGDSSANIKAGHIIRKSRSLENQVSQELVEKGTQYFNQCSATLSEYCTTIKSYESSDLRFEIPSLPSSAQA